MDAIKWGKRIKKTSCLHTGTNVGKKRAENKFGFVCFREFISIQSTLDTGIHLCNVNDDDNKKVIQPQNEHFNI